MRKLFVASSVAALLALPSLGAAHDSSADDPEHVVYWHSSSGIYIKDSDGDCIRTSSWFEGTQVEGCDEILVKDSDGDGVPDDQDRCPDTPAGTRVNSLGCELDSDGDGVVDSRDKCPNTPRGAKVNSQGCELDSDGDGVIDSRDQCPGTRAGAKVDAKGCEVPEFEAVTVDLDVHFEFNSAKVRSAYATQMGAMAHVLKSNPNAQVQIAGHTDSIGGAQYNMDLSKARAEAVKEHLVTEYGVNPDQLTTVGYGESRPLATNDTPEGRLLNRRVEAEISARVRK